MPHFESEEKAREIMRYEEPIGFFRNFWNSLKEFWRSAVLVPWWMSRFEKKLKAKEPIYSNALEEAMRERIELEIEEYDELEEMQFTLAQAQFTIDTLSDENTHLKNLLGQAIDQGFQFTETD